ncbi:MAG: hypothetical protein JO001_11785 [Alphaproteobacteria bacterium]|nr:hypothetical protein [Alphaproteobacteria bacterium]
MPARLGALAGVAAVLVASVGRAGEADPAAGRAFAMQACAGCHVVGLNQPSAPWRQPPGPSFFDVAKEPQASAGWLANYLSRTHPGGDDSYPPLTAAQASDIATYITELRRRR